MFFQRLCGFSQGGRDSPSNRNFILGLNIESCLFELQNMFLSVSPLSPFVSLCLPLFLESPLVSPRLPLSPLISLCLQVSPCVSFCSPLSPLVSLCLPVSPCVSLGLPESFSVPLPFPLSPFVSLCGKTLWNAVILYIASPKWSPNLYFSF